MRKVKLWPYKMGSAGCKELQDALVAQGVDALRVRSDGNYRPRANHLIINWGNSQVPRWMDRAECRGLNVPAAVVKAANKLHTFVALTENDVSVPHWETQRQWAEAYVNSGRVVYCRTKLSGHSGEGIVVARTAEELVDAPLYTVGINSGGEYRVHVFNGAVIDVVKKRRRNEALDDGTLNMDVRNLAGGWVFAHSNVELSDEAKQEAIKAVAALGLDFGAVDMIIEKRTNKPFVLEINTAPGLGSPTTIAAYVNTIKEMLI